MAHSRASAGKSGMIQGAFCKVSGEMFHLDEFKTTHGSKMNWKPAYLERNDVDVK